MSDERQVKALLPFAILLWLITGLLLCLALAFHIMALQITFNIGAWAYVAIPAGVWLQRFIVRLIRSHRIGNT